MKKLGMYLVSIIIALGLTGCGSPKFLDGVSPAGKDFNSGVNRDNGNLKLMTTVESDNIKKRFPLLVKAAAIEFKKQGVEYFSIYNSYLIGPFGFESGMNENITNGKDMFNYCFPNAFGLEVKCSAMEKSKNAFFIFKAEVKSFEKPLWSVKEVLEDNFYNIDSEQLVFKELTMKETFNLK
jgi:hypothetical protein